MIDRSKCEKMLVWNSREDEAVERIVIDINDDGSCKAVHECVEQDFIEGRSYITLNWGHCKPIPKKKKRYMTRDEVFGFIANTPGLVCRYQDNKFFSATFWSYNEKNIHDYEYATIDIKGNIGEWKKFEVEVEE